jgi:uncharacterized Zn finger protein
MITLVLKNGRQISAERAEDIDTFWTKEEANRSAAQMKIQRAKKRFPMKLAKKD